MVRVKEIFTSVQGEGPFIGYKQLFIRFCGCNLSCKYCDTDYSTDNSKEYRANELAEICNSNRDCHSVSLTGGEPLLHAEFLSEFLPECNLPVYLETNATLPEQLKNIIKYIDYISADIKLPSCSENKPLWDTHTDFFEIGNSKTLFAKVVFDNKITSEEIEKICTLCKQYDIELVLQPKMNANNLSVSPDFMIKVLDECLTRHTKTRLIPQTHKFIGVI